MSTEQDGCVSCHFNPANAGKTGFEVSQRLNGAYWNDSNEKVASMVFKHDAAKGEIHCCNRHNPQLGAVDSKPCRGFIRVLLEHVESYTVHGYTHYAESKVDAALTEDQIRFWKTAIAALERFWP